MYSMYIDMSHHSVIHKELNLLFCSLHTCSWSFFVSQSPWPFPGLTRLFWDCRYSSCFLAFEVACSRAKHIIEKLWSLVQLLLQHAFHDITYTPNSVTSIFRGLQFGNVIYILMVACITSGSWTLLCHLQQLICSCSQVSQFQIQISKMLLPYFLWHLWSLKWRPHTWVGLKAAMALWLICDFCPDCTLKLQIALHRSPTPRLCCENSQIPDCIGKNYRLH